MCARRFLVFVFVLTLLFVGGAFAIYQWGSNVLLSQATPQGHFDAAKAGRGPDYRDFFDWIDHPELRRSPSLWTPDNDDWPRDTGWPPADQNRAAIFYVHPTTYLKTDRWNAPICEDEECGEAGAKAQLFVQSQASAFNHFGTIWAPHYRQAAFGAFLLKSEDASKAVDLAYGDVRAAFDVFLKAQPANKPLFLAAHSQGSLHLSRLLADRKEALKGRLVAAYVVGWPLSIRADLPAIGLPGCDRGDQTGCILSWQSFAEPANPDLILRAWEGTKGPTGINRERQDMLCVNPLTGSQHGLATASDRSGTIVPNADLSSATLTDGVVAQCRNGLLIIGGRIPAMGPYVLPGNNYHVYDYALFWGAIRRDAARRLAAWEAR